MSDRDILIDVSRLVWRFWRGGLPTGIDRVCLAYLQHFAARSQAVVQRRGQYYVFSPRHSDSLFELFLSESGGFRARFIRFAPAASLTATNSPQRSGLFYLNIGHTGLNEASLPRWIGRSGLRAIFLVHDLIPLTHPEYCRPGENEKHRQRMENVLRSAAGVIGNSPATIDELAGLAAERGLPMPTAVPAWIAGSHHQPPILARTFDRPHFITVGTIEGRKNHILLLRIWRRMVTELGPAAPLLVIVGQRGWEAQRAIAMLDDAGQFAGHVLEFGQCDDQELARLTAGARALLMPSFAEGFGLPVAEALEIGTPVIASDLPVFREFARDIPAYLNPRDCDAWERIILDFVTDSSEREGQLKALSGYRAPDWETHFKIVEEWLASLQD